MKMPTPARVLNQPGPIRKSVCGCSCLSLHSGTFTTLRWASVAQAGSLCDVQFAAMWRLRPRATQRPNRCFLNCRISLDSGRKCAVPGDWDR